MTAKDGIGQFVDHLLQRQEPVARVANIGETIRRLKEQGVFVYCADMDGVSLRRNNLTGPIALVLGSEGSGVSQLVKKLCGQAVVFCRRFFSFFGEMS